jgi:hypothetical protein
MKMIIKINIIMLIHIQQIQIIIIILLNKYKLCYVWIIFIHLN